MDEPDYVFTPKHRWQLKLNFLSGITTWPLLKLLHRHAWHIDWHLYWHRVLFLMIMSVLNTVLAVPDWWDSHVCHTSVRLLYRRRIASQPLNPAPLIILGHPRTGTTHLHNLLSNDPEFAFCNTFHAGFPSAFLCMGLMRHVLKPLLSPTRPMDNMALSWDLPAEDEIATMMLSGGTSPYMATVLAREERECFRPYYTFGLGAAEGAASGAEAGGKRVPQTCSDAAGAETAATAGKARLHEWRSCFVSFMKKVTLAGVLQDGGSARPRPLLIKSPVHTARVPLLLDLFPNARFLYIHRHPIQVFQSAAHMADTTYWYVNLQQPTDAATTEFILGQYDILFDEYIASRHAIPSGRLCELSFDELEADPISTLRSVYERFGWLDRFESLLPKFEAYCNTLGDFKRNHFNTLTPGMVQRVRRRWASSFREFGYPPNP